MAITLFIIFFKLGFFSFGGGYTMIPLVEQELLAQGIVFSPIDIANTAAIAGIAPGPVGINLAIAFGYQLGGVWGIFAAAIGVTLPSLIVVLLTAFFFKAVYNSPYFKGAMSGLKPFIVGITLYTAFNMTLKNGMICGEIKNILVSMSILIISLFLLLKTKIHPVFLIASGALAGIIFLS